MIPSSTNSLLLSLLFLSITNLAMERSSSGLVYSRPQGGIPTSPSLSSPPTKPLPTSSSKAFPPTKKDSSNATGSLRGSIIKKFVRSTSSRLGRHPSSEEIVLEHTLNSEIIPATTQPLISAPLTFVTLKKVAPTGTKKELIYGKPLYIYSLYEYEKKQGDQIALILKKRRVSLQGPCNKIYGVSCLRDFKEDDAHLQLEEILFFINTIAQKKLYTTLAIGNGMTFSERERAAHQAFEFIQAHKDLRELMIPFYLARTKDNSRICVFDSELEESKK